MSQVLVYKNPKKRELKAILGVLQKKHLNHDDDECRITLFRPSRFKAVLINIWATIRIGHRGFRTMYLKQAWNAFIKKRLIIHVRYGEPYEKSLTNFPIARNGEEVDGVASKAWYSSKMSEAVDLPRIDRQNWNRPKNIEIYRKKCKIKKGFLLKSIHQHARHILAMSVADSKAKKAMVLVIDSNKEKNPFNEEIKKNLQIYNNIIEKII